MRHMLIVIGLIYTVPLPSQAREIGFVEEFALAKDRAEVLKKLIPATEDYYYYHGIHYLNSEQFDKLPNLLASWTNRFGETARFQEIRTRQMLLLYSKDPQKSVDFIKWKLNPTFNHPKPNPGVAPDLPTTLDPNLISSDRLKAYSLDTWTLDLGNFEDIALELVANEKLNPEKRRNLLQRLTRPDIANLEQLIVDDLKAPNAPPFGSYAIHKQLTLTQLQNLVKLQPALFQQGPMVNIWLSKLWPSEDTDWKRDRAVLREYLNRLLEYSRKLNNVHNSLKSHVLYHRLVLDQLEGKEDRALFIEYLSLPRQQGYMSRKMLESQEGQRYPANLNANYTPLTQLPIVGNDEPVVRAYLKTFFSQTATIKDFEPYIEITYLNHLFAETKILNGLGDPEQWASLLPPEVFKLLKDRVDIDFAATNPTQFTVDEPVQLKVGLKNVSNLIIKVFEINTTNFYKNNLREIDTDINLDGLVPNFEKVVSFNQPPLIRFQETFDFPQINKPGVYVVDLIGSGKSSRALIRKGKLRALTMQTSAGQYVQVINEKKQSVKGAKIWLNGQEYGMDESGMILIPYSTAPSRQPIVIQLGSFASLESLNHQAENYQLSAGMYVDRESLLQEQLAKVIIRPRLTVNGVPVAISTLQNVRLQISAVDQDGIASSNVVSSFPLFEDRESVHEFRVPARLLRLNFQLIADIKQLSTDKTITLSTSEEFSLNGIHQTDKIEDLHFAKFGTDYVLELLGRTGEPRPDKAINLRIKNRLFKQTVNVQLKTDANGRIVLGKLTDITAIDATSSEGTNYHWDLAKDVHSYREVVHSLQGQQIRLPYLGKEKVATRQEFALFAMHGNTIQADYFEAIQLLNNSIQVQGLPIGDYELNLKTSGERIRIRITSGVEVRNYALGDHRYLQLPQLQPVQITAIEPIENKIRIQLQDVSSFTRVHVIASRYIPEFDAARTLGKIRDNPLQGTTISKADSVFVAGRAIGDEYQYVLDRRNQKKYPGNPLERPSFLLNPWARRATETAVQGVEEGQDFAPKGESAPAMETPGLAAAKPTSGAMIAGRFSTLDFLQEGSVVLSNLLPDKEGKIDIDRKIFDEKTYLQVIVVDPLHTTIKTVSLPEVKPSLYDLRLAKGLDPKQHFIQQKQISLLQAKQVFEIDGALSNRFEIYDSLSKVYGLFRTANNDAKLAEFNFILNWPNLKLEEKLALYSKHACHELNFFIYKKDQAFFEKVVRPYLANKKDKTFLDEWLLQANLTPYRAAWQYHRLNTMERILLAQSFPNELEKTARHLEDRYRLAKVGADRLDLLFDLGLGADGLKKNADRPLEEFRRKEMKSLELKLSESSTPAGQMNAPAPTGGMLGGGLGGRGAAPSREEAARRGLERSKLEDKLRSRSADEKAKQQMDMDKEEMGLDAKEHFYKERESARRYQRLYRKTDPTQEMAENNYHHLYNNQQLEDLVAINPFWIDYVKHDGKSPFLSKNMSFASRNFTEMMFALSILDLPFEEQKSNLKFEKGKIVYTPNRASILFHEEIRPIAKANDKVQILVSQNFYRPSDRYRLEDGETLDKFIRDEFVKQTVYGCQLVITNPTSAKQKLNVLYQIPTGAIAVSNGKPTKSMYLDLEPYRTQTIDYFFYFPLKGNYNHFPVHISKGDVLVASVPAFTFDVVDQPTKIDKDAWDYIAIFGTDRQVLEFLQRENLFALNLDLLAFRLKNVDFYNSLLSLLQDRKYYSPLVWSYGLYHHQVPVIQQYLQYVDSFVQEIGGSIQSPLLTISPVLRHAYEHLEYSPLVNARTHQLGKERQIVNDGFYNQYQQFLKQLTYHATLSDDDLLGLTYYLLLQDRIEEAEKTFQRIDVNKVSTKIQLDYCKAYLDLFQDEPKQARKIAQQYSNYPVDRWKNRFVAILNYLDEAEGKGAKVANQEDPQQIQAELAAKQPSFELLPDAKGAMITSQNLEKVQVNYYLMDVELLFSRNPFVQQSGNQFASITPNRSQTVTLKANEPKQLLELPAELMKRNVLIEVTAAGKSRSVAYYSNAMNVQLTENYGQLKVTAMGSNKPLAKVYVKTYVRLPGGEVKFHKDGYTDHRGRFDYASISGPASISPERYSILILSEENGAFIREAAPPQQ